MSLPDNRWPKAPAGPRRKYPRLSPAECRQDRIGKLGNSVSRRLRTLPFREAGDPASALGAEHLLRAIRGIFGSGRGGGRKRVSGDKLHDFVAVQDLALQ